MSMNGTPTTTTVDAYLAPLEPAARILCGMRGEDADSLVQVPHPQGIVAYYQRPLWCFAADELLSFNQCAAALRQYAAESAQATTTRVQ